MHAGGPHLVGAGSPCPTQGREVGAASPMNQGVVQVGTSWVEAAVHLLFLSTYIWGGVRAGVGPLPPSTPPLSKGEALSGSVFAFHYASDA